MGETTKGDDKTLSKKDGEGLEMYEIKANINSTLEWKHEDEETLKMAQPNKVFHYYVKNPGKVLIILFFI
jgi:hypothetical protein